MKYQQDNTLFGEIVRQRQDSYHSKVEQGLKDYLLTVHNVDYKALLKQLTNCNNFRLKRDKFYKITQLQGHFNREVYYFGEELILTGYPYDQQVVYGAWKAMQQGFCC